MSQKYYLFSGDAGRYAPINATLHKKPPRTHHTAPHKLYKVRGGLLCSGTKVEHTGEEGEAFRTI